MDNNENSLSLNEHEYLEKHFGKLPGQAKDQSLADYINILLTSDKEALHLLINLHKFVTKSLDHSHERQLALIAEDIKHKNYPFGKYALNTAAAFKILVENGSIDYWLHIPQAAIGEEGSVARILDQSQVDAYVYSRQYGGKVLQFGTNPNDVSKKWRKLVHFYEFHASTSNIIGIVGVRNQHTGLKDPSILADEIYDIYSQTSAIVPGTWGNRW